MRFLLITTLLLITFSCKKEVFNPYPDYFTGTAIASLNGLENGWQSRTFLSFFEPTNNYRIACIIKNDAGEDRQKISIGPITKNTDTIRPFLVPPGMVSSPTEPNVFFNTSIFDGDVGCAYYDLLESYPNILIIEEFNVDRGYVKGKFDLAYVKVFEANCPVPELDTVILSDGVFEVDGISFN